MITFKQFLEEAKKDVRQGNWDVTNLAGWTKTFKDIDSAEARRWMSNRDPKPPPANRLTPSEREWRDQRKEWDRQDREEERAKRKAKKENQSSYRIWAEFEEAVGESFPDGDPLDRMSAWMDRNDVDMDMLNKAVRANCRMKGVKTYEDYLAIMWDEMQGMALHDATNGHIDSNSPYYDVKGTSIIPDMHADPEVQKELEKKIGERRVITPTPNPWRS